MIIKSAQIADSAAIADIYNHYILTTVITFEETPLDGAEISARISESQEQNMPWLVAENEGRDITGYAYASRWKGRCAYRYSAEVTVYVSPSHVGQGIGTQLYTALFEKLKALGYHVAIAGISLPNTPSIKLHEAFGMTQAGLFKEVGFKFGQWVDVGYWQGFLGETPG